MFGMEESRNWLNLLEGVEVLEKNVWNEGPKIDRTSEVLKIKIQRYCRSR